MAMVPQLSDLVSHYPIRCSIAEHLTTRELRAIACTSKENYDHIVGTRPEMFANLKKYTTCEGNFVGPHRIPFKEEVGKLILRRRNPCLGRVGTFCERCGATLCTNCCRDTFRYAILLCGGFGWLLPCEDPNMTVHCPKCFGPASASECSIQPSSRLIGNKNYPSEDQAKDHICPRCFVEKVRLQFRYNSPVKECLGHLVFTYRRESRHYRIGKPLGLTDSYARSMNVIWICYNYSPAVEVVVIARLADYTSKNVDWPKAWAGAP